MKQFVLLSWFLLSGTLLSAQSDPKIHVIKILDYHSEAPAEDGTPDGGYTMKYASESIDGYITSTTAYISKALGLTAPPNFIELNDKEVNVDFADFEKNAFSRTKLQSKLDSLVCSNDIVLVVYSGHGFTFRDDNYPNLMLNYSNNPVPYWNYEQIISKILSKKPKLCISMISACQTVPPTNVAQHIKDNEQNYNSLSDFSTKSFGSRWTTASATSNVTNTAKEMSVERVKDLFGLASNSGDINNEYNTIYVELLSSSKGEKTYIDPRGGHFFRAIRSAFDKNLYENQATTKWEYVAFCVDSLTKAYIQNYNNSAEDEGHHIQNPQCRVYKVGTGLSNKVELKYTPVVTGGSLANPSTSATPNVILSSVSDYYAPYQKRISYAFALRLTKLSNTYREAGCYQCALDALDAAEPVLKSNGDKYFTAAAIEQRGLVHLDMYWRTKNESDKQLAVQYFKSCIIVFNKLNCCGSVNTLRSRLLDLGVASDDLKLKCVIK